MRTLRGARWSSSRSATLCARTGWLFAVALLAAAPQQGSAEDQSVDGHKLLLRRAKSGAERFVFVTKDPAALFPGIGSADDPTTGAPGGLIVDLVSGVEGAVRYVAPPGSTGWAVRDRKIDSYRYRNPSAPAGPSEVKVVRMREGKGLKIMVSAVGLPLAIAQEWLTVRVISGTQRTCARFDMSSIVKNEPDRLVARGAPASALADCSDGAIGLLPACDGSLNCGGYCPNDGACVADTLSGGECVCVSPHQPCGGSAPACNGTCAVGESCMDLDVSPFSDCQCIPDGATPCELSGFPACGGDCAPGLECLPARLTASPSLPLFDACACAPPAPCSDAASGSLGMCLGGLQCGPGEVCERHQALDILFCGCASL